MTRSSEHAYATLLMTDNYLPGAMVLGHSLRDCGTTKQLIALVTTETVSAATINELRKVYDQIISIERIRNALPANLYLMGREDLVSTFSKIALWSLTQFRRLVYIDADVVALRAPEELFDLKSNFAAAPDAGWPDIFNSGVMALTPNPQDFHALQSLATNGVSFDGADQGLLNMHFSHNSWERLSFTYNCTPSGNYQYAPAYRHFGSQISLIHFIGRQKPWQTGRHASGFGSVYRELTARWWAVYDKYYGYPTPVPSPNPPPAVISSAASQPAPTRVHAQTQEQSYVHTQENASTSISAPSEGSPKHHSNYQSSHSAPRNETQQQPTVVQTHVYDNPIPMLVVTPPQALVPVQPQPERRFSIPHAEWNPAREPPPAQSRPEAANFPSNVYEMSFDTQLYKPPVSYPEPPRDMYYEVPKEKPKVSERPKAIFPWESRQPPISRVFPEEAPLPPVPDPDRQPEPLPTLDTSGAETLPSNDGSTSDQTNPVPPSIGTSGINEAAFQSYSRVNAWDLIPGIQNYVSAWESRRKARHSPASSLSGIVSQRKGNDRRPSLILTDFPTEVERPSLPVTPAPIRAGTTFWGTEKSAENLPDAKGVPPPSVWDPYFGLEELQRKQSEAFLAGPSLSKSLPNREQIVSAVNSTIAEEAELPQEELEGISALRHDSDVQMSVAVGGHTSQLIAPKPLVVSELTLLAEPPMFDEEPDTSPAELTDHPGSDQAPNTHVAEEPANSEQHAQSLLASEPVSDIHSAASDVESKLQTGTSETLRLREQSPEVQSNISTGNHEALRTGSTVLPLLDDSSSTSTNLLEENQHTLDGNQNIISSATKTSINAPISLGGIPEDQAPEQGTLGPEKQSSSAVPIAIEGQASVAPMNLKELAEPSADVPNVQASILNANDVEHSKIEDDSVQPPILDKSTEPVAKSDLNGSIIKTGTG